MLIPSYLGVRGKYDGSAEIRIVVKSFTFVDGYTETLTQQDLGLVNTYQYVQIICAPFLDTDDGNLPVYTGLDTKTMKLHARKEGWGKEYSGTTWITYLIAASSDK